MAERARPDRNADPKPDLRAPERALLEEWLMTDPGSAVLVQGRQGVGKSHLVGDLTRVARDATGVAVFEGHAPEVRGRSFQPFAEVAQEVLSWAATRRLYDALIQPVYALLAPVLQYGAAEAEPGPALDQKLAFFEGFRRLLGGVSHHARPLVVLHDLDRADTDTLELAAYLADELYGNASLGSDAAARGLLCLLVRDDSGRARVDDFITDLADRPYVRRVKLDGLDLEGLKRYLQSPHVVEKLLTASDGLPQEIDALIEALPNNVEELFARKLGSLSTLEREALFALALSGRPVAPRTAARVLDQPTRDVARALNRMREDRIVDRRIVRGELMFTFSRRRDLEVAERTLSAEERARLHGGWARALCHESEGGGPALLAHHQLRSSEPQRGVALAVQAADAYAVSGALNAAIEMLESARPHASGELRLSILNRLAELAPQTGLPQRALRYVAEMKEALPERERGPAFVLEAELHNAAGDYGLTLAALAHARAITTAPAAYRAQVEAAASEAHYHRFELEDAERAAKHGLAALEEDDAEPTRLDIQLLNELGKIALAGGAPDRAIAYFERTLAASEQRGLASETARALVNLGMAHIRRNEAGKAEERLLQGIDKAREANDLTRLAFGMMNLGVLVHQLGELGRAIECYRECRALFRRLGNRTQLARVLHNLGSLHLLLGDFWQARAYNDEALRLAQKSEAERLVAIATAVDGIIHSEFGDFETGEQRLRDSLRLHQRLGSERGLETLLELIELKLRRGDVEGADELLENARRQALAMDSPVLRARTDLLDGRARLARDEDATELFERARSAFEELGRQLMVGESELLLARALSWGGKRETGRIHLEAARAIVASVAEQLPEALAETFRNSRLCRAVHDVQAKLDGQIPGRRPTPRIPEPPAAGAMARKPEWQAKYRAIVGESPKLHRVFHMLDRLERSEGTVLIAGESGTGKELVAEAIHRNSPRAKGPFVKLNCAALVESLLLSELFGHERGSFTGAHQRKIGRFEMSAGGTLFLDEIGDISPKTQIALLRVLQEREFERVGGGRPIKVDARIIFATNRNLAQMVREASFREDLYYRLKGLTIDLPPVRERPEDIPALTEHFLRQYASESGTAIKRLTPRAVQLLTRYAWPGNVRELENIIRSVALFTEGSQITVREFDEYRELFGEGLDLEAGEPPADLEARPASGTVPLPSSAARAEPPDPTALIEGELLGHIFDQGIALPELKKRIQNQAIGRALRLSEGNITRAAEMLGMRRPRLSQIINADEDLKALCQGSNR